MAQNDRQTDKQTDRQTDGHGDSMTDPAQRAESVKILHTGNTRPSRTCVINEYRYYTMSLGQYHGCCQYHKSMSIPWVFPKTMSPCLYHESMSIPWVHVYTISLFLYHESMSIPWVFVKSMLPCLYHEKYSFQIYRNTNNKNKEIQIIELQKYNLQIYRNTK